MTDRSHRRRSVSASLRVAFLLALAGTAVDIWGWGCRPAFAEDPAPAEQEVAQPPPRKPGNLLPALIRRAFGAAAAQSEETPGEPAIDESGGPTASPNRNRAARDTSDPRAPIDAKTSSWLARAQALAHDGDWQEAFELLQRVAEQAEDSLFRTADGEWISAKLQGDRLRGSAPAEVLREYRQKYGGLARQMLSDAQKSGDARQIGRVAQGYFHTDAGYEAANRLATMHLDRGEYPLAARWLAEMWAARATLTHDPIWRAKAGLALARAGRLELAQTLVGDDDAMPLLGGQRLKAAAWLADGAQTHRPAASPLAEWPMFYGNEAHTGIATGGAPLLLPRWHHALTDNAQIHRQIEQLCEDLSDQGTIPMPASFALAVGGRIVVRTLRGMTVIDAPSGRELWSTTEPQLIEQLLGAAGRRSVELGGGVELFQRQVVFPPLNAPGWNASLAGVYGSSGEHGPLANLLYRNAGFGLASSDGRRLFVVEDEAFLTPRQPGNPWQWDGGPGATPEPGNRLTSYDLETGRPLWTAGGTPLGEPFDPRLAGYFFFGPPVVAGEELLVIGEATSGDCSDQIRLLSLDAKTGEERWSQLIAFAEVPIAKDVGRRWWVAQPAVSEGLVICPTTVGWLAAVDRATHRLMWGYRQPPPVASRQIAGRGDQQQAAAMVPQAPLYGQWGAAPLVAGEGRVFCAVPESQSLICLDQSTGREVWNKPRGDGLYLAGVFQGLALVVGRDGVAAYAAADGALRWKRNTPCPTGRGVALREQYLLPVAAGELWTLDLQDGRVVAKTYLSGAEAGLGNLLMYRGLLLSLDSFGLTAFEQRDAIRAEIDRRLRAAPDDAPALLRMAEIQASDRKPTEALRALRRIAATTLTGSAKNRYRSLVVSALTNLIQADPAHADANARLAELAAAIESAEEIRQLRRLRATVFIAQADFSRAFDALLELANDDAADLLARDDDPAVLVRPAAWAAGRLADFLNELPAARRRTFDGAIAARAADASAENSDAQRVFLSVFGWHAMANEVRFRLAAALADRGEFLEADRLFSEISSSGTRAERALALDRQAQLMTQFDLTADALRCYQRLEREFGDVVVHAGLTGSRLVRELRQAGRLPATSPAIVDWQAGSIRVERLGAQHVNYVPQELSTTGSPALYFRQHSFDIDHATQRLEVESFADNEPRWSQPLRAQAGTTEGGMSLALAAGHQLTILHRGVIHVISPVERRVLWTRALEGRIPAQLAVARNTSPLQPMQSPAFLADRLAQFQATAGASPLAVANMRYVCQQDRRRLTVVDARTGEILWTYSGLRPGTQVLGGPNFIYLRSLTSQTIDAFRVLDGKRVALPRPTEALGRAIGLVDDAFVLPNAEGASSGLRLYDPVNDKDLWTIAFQPGVLIGTIDPYRLAVLEKGDRGGRFQQLNLETGQVQLLGELTPEELKGQLEFFALADGLNVYLLLNARHNNQFYSEQVPFVRASGLILAFDPIQAALRWKRSITGQNLLLERLEASPLLLFASRRHEQRGRLSYWSLHLVGLDKLSGAKLLDEKSAAQPGFRSVTVNSADRYVELRSYNERVRLYPVEKAAVEGSAGD
ncbi:MAG: outer membrane protein assembly factor BamB family protein [Planctomycetaceae bacterium]